MEPSLVCANNNHTSLFFILVLSFRHISTLLFYLSDQFIACGESRDIAHQLASRIWLAVLHNLDDNHHTFSMLKRLAHEGDVSLSVFLSVALIKKIVRRCNQPNLTCFFFMNFLLMNLPVLVRFPFNFFLQHMFLHFSTYLGYPFGISILCLYHSNV